MKGLPNKRDLYFFLDRIGLSQNELRGLQIILFVLVLIEIFNVFSTQFQDSSEYNYDELNLKIEAKTNQLQAQYDSVLQAQYYPTELSRETQSTSSKKAKTKKLSSKNIESIDINTATAVEITALPGIGIKTAEAIIEYRKNNGRFYQIEELKKIKGIGEKKLEQIRPFIKIIN